MLTTTKATLKYTDANVTQTVNDYKSKATLLGALQTTVPLGGLVLGLVLIDAGTETAGQVEHDPDHHEEHADVEGQ